MLRLAMIGFGNVGQGLTRILNEQQTALQKQGLTISIVAVCDITRGSICDPEGLSPAALLQAVESGDLTALPAPYKGWDARRTIAESGADMIAEMSYTNLETGQPASDLIELALSTGKHVTTTNKGPIALHYEKLHKIAKRNHVYLGFEGTVMSGTPAIGLGQQFLAAAGIQAVQGIFNGTTNFMLTAMAHGATYQEALADAQARGYAEADPSGDVEGFDAAAKVVILAQLLFGRQLSLSQMSRQGISQLTHEQIVAAQKQGKRYKLLGTLAFNGEELEAMVAPVAIDNTHPLYGIEGATNAITYTTDLLGQVTLSGPGAGRLETGYALIQDMIAALNHK